MLSARAMNWSVVTFPPALQSRPALEDPEEVVVADRLAQRRGSVIAPRDVDREVELVARHRDHRSSAAQNGSSSGKMLAAEVEDRLGAVAAIVLAPEPLGVGREALVEPDVLTSARRPRLSPYHWCAFSWTTTLSSSPGL